MGLRCDSHWSQIPKNSADKVHEAHWVNVRTNPQYKVENAHAKIIGRDIWWSKDTVVPDVRKTMVELMADNKHISQGVDKVLDVPGADQVSDTESGLKRIHRQKDFASFAIFGACTDSSECYSFCPDLTVLRTRSMQEGGMSLYILCFTIII